MIKQIIYTSVRLLHFFVLDVYIVWMYVLNIFIYFSVNYMIRFIYNIDNLFASDTNVSCEHTYIKHITTAEHCFTKRSIQQKSDLI